MNATTNVPHLRNFADFSRFCHEREEILTDMTYQELLGCIFIIVSLTASYFIGWVRGVKYGFGVRGFANSIVSRLTNIKVTHTQNADENTEQQ